MYRMIMLIPLVCWFISAPAYGEETRSEAEKRFEWFKVHLELAKEHLGVRRTIRVSMVTSIDRRLGYSPAWINNGGDARRASVYGMASFLEVATQPILEHVAYHELCHAKSGHLERLAAQSDDEYQVEFCIVRAVGLRRYRDYLGAYQDWHVSTRGLTAARAQLLHRLGVVIDYTQVYGVPPLR